MNSLDWLFWTTLRSVWWWWAEVLVVVKPETVVGWHRAEFRLFWGWRPRVHGGRPKTTAEIRALIIRMADENLNWGAPKIHGELKKLGFEASERTVARYLQGYRRCGDPGKRWLAFLQNHSEVIVAFDFFTVPTFTFKLLYCFFVIEHGRCSVLHFRMTQHPTAEWGLRGSSPVRNVAACGGSGSDYPQVFEPVRVAAIERGTTPGVMQRKAVLRNMMHRSPFLKRHQESLWSMVPQNCTEVSAGSAGTPVGERLTSALSFDKIAFGSGSSAVISSGFIGIAVRSRRHG